MAQIEKFRRLKWSEPKRLRAPWGKPARNRLFDAVWLPLLAFAMSLTVGWLVFSGTAEKLLDAAAAQGPLVAFGEPSANGLVEARFSLCNRGRPSSCVVDGDTFHHGGETYRIADIDTPEVSKPRCGHEKQLGDTATLRLLDLLNAGPFELERIDRDTDVYGRKLRIVSRNGRSLGDVLVAENLAHVWDGGKHPWC